MKNLLLGTLFLTAIVAILIFSQHDKLMARALESQVIPRLSGQIFSDLPDGLHVMLCGAGSPLPDPKRSGPCTVVVAGERAFVFDIGSGAAGNIGLMGIPSERLEAVLLTHFHSDHIDGLGELLLQRWAGSGATSALPIYGAKGVNSVVAGFNQAYTVDASYRVAHHGQATIPAGGFGGTARVFSIPEGGQLLTVIEDADLKISAFNVQHGPIHPAVGYRIDYKDRSVVLSGDTSPSENLMRHAIGVDLLVHEAQSTQLVNMLREAARKAGNQQMTTILGDILDYHTEPVDAAKIATEVGAKHLLLHHIVPALPVKPMEMMFMRGVSDHFSGGITLGEDGTSILMPSGNDKIQVVNLLP